MVLRRRGSEARKFLISSEKRPTLEISSSYGDNLTIVNSFDTKLSCFALIDSKRGKEDSLILPQSATTFQGLSYLREKSPANEVAVSDL